MVGTTRAVAVSAVFDRIQWKAVNPLLARWSKRMSWPHRLFASQFSDFELKLLRVFHVVVECHGYTDAEVELGLTKSAISKSLSDLEVRFGVRLCERGRGGFHLTTAGQAVYDATTTLFAAFEEFRARVNCFHSTLTGEFFCGFIEGISTATESTMQNAIAAYTRRHPAIRMNMIVGSAAEIDRAVEEQRLHVGISVLERETPVVMWKELYTEMSHLYRASILSNDLKHLETDVDELIRHLPFVKHGYSTEETRLVDELELKVSATSNHTEGILLLILSGSYIGFLPDDWARLWESSGAIMRLGVDGPIKRTRIVIKWNSNASGNPIVKEFLSIAQPIFGEPLRTVRAHSTTPQF